MKIVEEVKRRIEEDLIKVGFLPGLYQLDIATCPTRPMKYTFTPAESREMVVQDLRNWYKLSDGAAQCTGLISVAPINDFIAHRYLVSVDECGKIFLEELLVTETMTITYHCSELQEV